MSVTSKGTLERNQDEANDGRRLHFYAKGEEIPVVTQGVWQVERGLVQFSTLCPNGEEVLLGWAAPSAFFGLWLFKALKECYPSAEPSFYTSYKAISNVYLKWYSTTEIEASPSLCQALLPQMGRRIRQTEALLAINGQRRVEDRLYQLLLLLKQEVGQTVGEGTRISIRLTHQDLANAINTTRVTVTRLLSNFKRQGLITLDSDRHIILKDERFMSVSDW
jgi:CRP-like cAMP-binding protein